MDLANASVLGIYSLYLETEEASKTFFVPTTQFIVAYIRQLLQFDTS